MLNWSAIGSLVGVIVWLCCVRKGLWPLLRSLAAGGAGGLLGGIGNYVLHFGQKTHFVTETGFVLMSSLAFCALSLLYDKNKALQMEAQGGKL